MDNSWMTPCAGSGTDIMVHERDMSRRPPYARLGHARIVDRPAWTRCPVCRKVVQTRRDWSHVGVHKYLVTIEVHA